MLKIICLDTFRKERILSEPFGMPVYFEDRITAFEKAKTSILARFEDNLPKHFQKYLDNPKLVDTAYIFGCSHNVKYRPRRKNWNKPMPLPAMINPKLEHLGKGMESGGTPDSFAWLDMKYGIAKEFLQNKPIGSKLVIETRSDLIAHDDYVSELLRIGNVKVIMWLYPGTESVARIQEPGVASNKRRKTAVSKLKKCGVSVEIRYVDLKLKKSA